MRESLALIRSTWLTASSYRVSMLFSLFGLIFVLLPLYFIANALQPIMADTIAGEARQYFGFVVLGAIVFSLVSSSTTSLPSALGEAIGRGTLEVILATPARLAAVCAGLMGYGIIWAVVRAVILLTVAVWLGASITWEGLPVGVLLIVLTMACYVGLALILSALILAFRTAGPLATGLLTASMFLGGVYYPANVVPSWIRHFADFIPLTYGLRALRQILLRGDSVVSIVRDLQMLSAMTVVSLTVGVAAFCLALRRARRDGTLSSY